VTTIYAALHLKEEPCRRRKFVWHSEKSPGKIIIDSQEINGEMSSWKIPYHKLNSRGKTSRGKKM
jgi:hypothetical protein